LIYCTFPALIDMQKFLPKIKFYFFTLLFLLVLTLNLSPLIARPAFAQAATSAAEGAWVKDDDVTFAGKVAARSGQFLDWALANYNWSSAAGVSDNPLASFWSTIRNIVYAFTTLFVLISAFVIIVTRGKNITIMRFIPRFIMIVLLVTLSFSIIQFIYQIMDAIQGFFLTNKSGDIISQKDLLFVGFNYPDFQGYRLLGGQYDESVFVSLLLVKLTALTYYVMVGVLLLRKIILWFFIVISPIFPLLLLYSPIRNTAKIWVGEFFRWLLYAPIFAIFLSGLVHLWSSNPGIPLKFNFNKPEEYPTAISILLGGPGQIVSLTNSVNNPDTFALYVVALLMLWVVIILPFLLLQIFLDFLHDFSFGENTLLKQLVSGGASLIGRGNGGQLPPSSSAPAGLAKPLPFISSKIAIPQIRSNEVNISTQAANIQSASGRVGTEVLRLANLSVPTMRDIARYETSLMSSSIGSHQELAKMHEALEGIADPKRVTSPAQRQRFNLINERLKQEAQRGDPLANSILSAADSVTGKQAVVDGGRLNTLFNSLNNPAAASPEDRQKLKAINSLLAEASRKGDPLAASVLSAVQKGNAGMDDGLKQNLLEAKEKGDQLAISILEAAGSEGIKFDAAFPVANRVQAVSIDDYESVKKIWQENYLKLDPPKTIEGKQKNRKEWVKSDIEKISKTIDLLISSEPQNVSKGMEEVGAILPFLLIGGFAQTEVIAYLKAKLEAAKTVVSEMDKQQENEDTMLGAEKKKEEKPKEMKLEEQREIEESENQLKPSSKEDIKTNE